MRGQRLNDDKRSRGGRGVVLVEAGQAWIVVHESGWLDAGCAGGVGWAGLDEHPGVARAVREEVVVGIQVVVRRDRDGQQETEKIERSRAAGSALEPARQTQGPPVVTLHCRAFRHRANSREFPETISVESVCP